MKTLALSFALGAAVLCGGSVASAAPAQKQAPFASHSDSAKQATDMSSRRHWRRYGWHRHWRHYGWHRWHHRHWGYYRPYYRSYGYYPGYYRPAPVVSFGFGFGGPRWGGGWGHGWRHHHW